MKRASPPLLLAAFLLGLACEPAVAATPLRIFAASSLTEVLEEIGKLYGAQHPEDSIEFNFGGSQLLRVQIEQGARADVFASADRVHIEALQNQGLAGPDRVIARNRLVVVTPRREPKACALGDLAQPGLRIVIAHPGVPVGRYTLQVLAKMSGNGLFGDDFEERVAANIVSQETNVRAVLAKVALDEVDAGFVYATDARTSDGVIVLDIPDSLNVSAEYSMAVLRNGPNQAGGSRFVTFVSGAEGQKILAEHGFVPAR